MDEPYNLQKQIYKILNTDDFTVLLSKEEIDFMYKIITTRHDVLNLINENTSRFFINGEIQLHNIPTLFLNISIIYNNNCSINSSLFLSNITRFTIDSLFCYKIYNMTEKELNNIENAIDNCRQLSLFQYKRNIPPTNWWNGWFSFCP
jgi:hypothetical protein